MRLTGRGFLIALVGFVIGVAGMLPYLRLLAIPGYFITLAGVVTGFIGMFAPVDSSLFRAVLRRVYRNPLDLDE